MTKRIIIVGEDGDVVVKLVRAEKHEKKEIRNDTLDTLLISKTLIPKMEIRVESVFRPGKEDVETCYALSGDEILTNLHKFTSSEVIRKATPIEVHTKTEAKIRQILDEYFDVGLPSTVVDVHTHPKGSVELSPQDISNNLKAYRVYNRFFKKVYFAVHAISEEGRFKRANPIIKSNRIIWTSITRKHEVAFYDFKGKPVEVRLV